MTIYTVETLLGVIRECRQQGMKIHSVWEYINSANGKKMFAVFTTNQYCDIYTSPYVENPVLIWDLQTGQFIGDYASLNKQL